MDSTMFDHLSRLFAQTATRRSALTLVASLGLAGSTTAAGKKRKKRKNRCGGGCGPCQECRKQGKTRRCLPSRDGSACDGGICQSGICTCAPDTCASLGRTCGPIDDGCGSSATCGVCSPGATPSCAGGTCDTCAAACPSGCLACYGRTNGANMCGVSATIDCAAACVTDADCPAATPTCIAVGADRGTNTSVSFAALCGTSLPGVCVSIAPC